MSDTRGWSVGDVGQVNALAPARGLNECFVGCLFVVTELKGWGFVAVIPVPLSLGQPAGQCFLRVPFVAADRIGAVPTPLEAGQLIGGDWLATKKSPESPTQS